VELEGEVVDPGWAPGPGRCPGLRGGDAVLGFFLGGWFSGRSVSDAEPSESEA
jgi:hypothetical protein